MAILVRGKSKCQLCGRVIGMAAKVVMFTSFLKMTHRFGRFSNGAFQRACFEVYPDREEVERLYKRAGELYKDAPRGSMEEYEAWEKEAKVGWLGEALKEFE